MNYPIRNVIFERIKRLGGVTTDLDLINSLQKDNISILEDDFNKVLLDLEIFGLIRVGWITKERKRIELVN
ncbi:hypothetical protein [Candidatus Nitrosocosmicus sp. SS]|jgi:hypothetical protein|uniref:hypothetical protein n=1 Tax=Candidatus Nitrosocosmicus agrestis TaxID=2563600 RepID=UPI00122E8095|nr:hypothetical protein [Candidatus Nitrosocosmicus sp. SS]KAA2280077.1 hypothetical protein F1Z66_11965 [Candidatus Nitrosocosmicus sp. SS]KAF0868300.1 hypothetical protein E5N71_10885 [Candidatus Nitrosocosmicus sp. SS]MDR4492534.1 hypothetical protein [Candidatus Nitrosocosmicus sp.]